MANVTAQPVKVLRAVLDRQSLNDLSGLTGLARSTWQGKRRRLLDLTLCDLLALHQARLIDLSITDPTAEDE